MKTIKARHKLIPAIIMLIVAAITMSTASYAWFTMSNRVEVTGVELTVVAPTNILIRQGGSTNTFLNNVNVSGLNVTGKLSHASSVDGVTMITVEDSTVGVNELGSIVVGTTMVATTTPVADGHDGYYLDYPLQLVNTGALDVKVGLDNLSITTVATSVAGTSIVNAVRFAILDSAKTTSLGIFSIDGDSATLAYDSTTSTVAATTLTTKADMFVLQSGGIADATSPTGAETIVIRVWIEGQDPACVSLNAGSSFAISFDLYVSDEDTAGTGF